MHRDKRKGWDKHCNHFSCKILYYLSGGCHHQMDMSDTGVPTCWEVFAIVQAKDDGALDYAFCSRYRRYHQVWDRFCSKNSEDLLIK